MKSPFLPLMAACAVALGFAGPLRADNSGVSIRVEQAIKSDMGTKDRYSRTHMRKLDIFITNDSSEPLELKVKHIIFGRDVLTHNLITAGQGENPVTVKPHSTEKVETAEAKVTAVEEHYDVKTKKKTDATGSTIVGSGVQVMQGTTLVAEYYDPPSMKDEWGKTVSVTPAAAAKPAAKPAATPAKKK